VAGFAVGRAIQKVADPDGRNTTEHGPRGPSSPFFLVYYACVLFCVGGAIYWLFGQVDRQLKRRELLLLRQREHVAAAGTLESSADLRAHELGSRVAHKLQTSILGNIIDKWASTQMFTIVVLLHSYYDWTPYTAEAVRNVRLALLWMHVICVLAVVCFLEVPIRLSLRCRFRCAHTRAFSRRSAAAARIRGLLHSRPDVWCGCRCPSPAAVLPCCLVLPCAR
jgi:hypothetical protein